LCRLDSGKVVLAIAAELCSAGQPMGLSAMASGGMGVSHFFMVLAQIIDSAALDWL
jgi:hypothetical protein